MTGYNITPWQCYHYPIIKFSEDKKWLFNPIYKKWILESPEEHVRISFIESLHHEYGWRLTRMATEKKIQNHAKNFRFDLIVYNQELKPYILVECKSYHKELTKDTCEQIANYNRGINAPYLWITNGHQHLIWSSEGMIIENNLHQILGNRYYEVSSDVNYWQYRGFIGNKMPLHQTKKLCDYLNYYFLYMNKFQINLVRWFTSPNKSFYHYFSFMDGINLSYICSMRATPQGDTQFLCIKKDNKLIHKVCFKISSNELIYESDIDTDTSTYSFSGEAFWEHIYQKNNPKKLMDLLLRYIRDQKKI